MEFDSSIYLEPGLDKPVLPVAGFEQGLHHGVGLFGADDRTYE
jgi:hypothetical protein